MASLKNPEKRSPLSSVNWSLFATLLGMVIIGLLALIPYGLTLEGREFTAELVPDLLVQFLVQIILYSALILAGMLLGRIIGLGAPLLTTWLKKNGAKVEWKSLLKPAVYGLAAGILLILLDLFLFVPRLEKQLQLIGEGIRPPAWQGFLASFYGGIVEEVLTRYFLLTLLAWLGSRLSRTPEGKPTRAVMWGSILVSWLVFGLGHLPAAPVMGIELTPLYIIRGLVLNAVGILYGWLYWKRGLESAMAAHFGTDLMIHVLGALLLT